MPEPIDQSSPEYIKAFLKRQTHMTIAVTCEDGSPWAVPVHIKLWDGDVLEWESDTGSIHSRAIEGEPQIAISMYQLTYGEYREFGFYAKATAEKAADLPDGRARYRAVMSAIWINGADHTKRSIDVDEVK